MINFGNLIDRFVKSSSPANGSNLPGQDANPTGDQLSRNWYEERYEGMTVQRNILLSVLILLLLLSIIATGAMVYIINLKRFDPFVIQIEEGTGAAKVVNPLSSTVIQGNESIARYFIKRYVTARETYNPVDFNTGAMTTVRLLSANNLYRDYRSFIKNEKNNPELKYGQKNTTYLTVKSWSKLSDDKYMLRFAITENEGNKTVYNKIAVIEYKYLPMELTEAESDINPIGFRVTGYRVDDDNS